MTVNLSFIIILKQLQFPSRQHCTFLSPRCFLGTVQYYMPSVLREWMGTASFFRTAGSWSPRGLLASVLFVTAGGSTKQSGGLKSYFMWTSLISYQVIFTVEMCQNKESFCITDFTVAMWTVCVISILTLWSSYTLKSVLSLTMGRWPYFTQFTCHTL